MSKLQKSRYEDFLAWLVADDWEPVDLDYAEGALAQLEKGGTNVWIEQDDPAAHNLEVVCSSLGLKTRLVEYYLRELRSGEWLGGNRFSSPKIRRAG